VFHALADAEPGTFYLTDFLVRHFDRLVIEDLKLNTHPTLRDSPLRPLHPGGVPRANRGRRTGCGGAARGRSASTAARGDSDRARVICNPR
jgi:hypothetical protein